ncbi:sugar-binding transcriptional regulator [Companilactobacillus baiquanensis]|uniref:Sugar-binding transcriptional regulator n=1 Tax=Companilactobacillus baiquanensis TaxID=2486005 RepID=A0ABW1UYM5_9LACO|nr:sugar-binding transcriptional regulator [Companilactobacillus baiquanensis]
MERVKSKRIRQSLKVARYYYENNLDQSKIAKEMGLSRPTISRLLQYAKDNGYVEINIKDPFDEASNLSTDLAKKFGLDKVIIAYAPSNNYQSIIKSLGKAGAEYLEDIVKDNDIIGVTWGFTLKEISDNLVPEDNIHQGIRIVQLKGSETDTTTDNYAHEVMKGFTNAFHATSDSLPLPVIFDNSETCKLVMQDRHINYIIEQGKKANIAVFTVGTVRDDAMLFNLGYLNDKEISTLKGSAVGDISSRFIDSKGQIADEALNSRTVGININELKDKEYSILVAGGEKKIAAIKAALIGKYANVLIIDENTANQLLNE